MSKQSDLLNLTDAISVSGTNVGIGTSSPSYAIHTKSGSGGVGLIESTSSNSDLYFKDSGTSYNYSNGIGSIGNALRFRSGDGTERMRIDSSGNVLVGTTTTYPAGAGVSGAFIESNGRIEASRASAAAMRANRNTNDGDIIEFRKDGTTVGSIGASGSATYLVLNTTSGAGVGLFGSSSNGGCLLPATGTGAAVDNVKDLGRSDIRWDDIYATNGTIQTSDRNEKQDIEALSDAEQRVAVACKGLIRKFRWKDAVAEKGDDARIHFGIIAQDLQDAFAAEGLDAGRYAMFISSTWWEADRVVPAVEATDDTEAVAEHTVTDHYDTLEEAPEGATERTRLGVRYPELLAFIIGAL